jgi:flagellum-specific peptidoglycan hydrolase FlgJ
MKRGSKKGILLKNVIEIILACLAIGIVIYAGVVLFRTYFGSQGEMQAKGALERVVQTLSRANESGATSEMLFTSPAGWYIVAFDSSHSENNGFVKQSKFKQDVVCVCKAGVRKRCTADLCRPIKMPLVQDSAQAFIEIKPSEVHFTNMDTYYAVGFRTTSIVNLSDDDKLRSIVYNPSNTSIDAWLKSKGSPLAGLGSCIDDVSKNTGIASGLILAVAIQETGWGKNNLATQCNNLFSIKSTGEECRITSAGATGIKSVPYEKYANQCASVIHFGNLISTSSKYAEAMQYKDDPERMAYAIHGCSGPYAGNACVYAEDTEWAAKVITIMNQIKAEVK